MLKPGSHYLGDRRCQFTLWAPLQQQVAVHLVSSQERLVPLERDERGYWQGIVEDVEPGSHYFFQLDGDTDRPDPASHAQPRGVHGPSQVVDHGRFTWGDRDWPGVSLEKLVVYELHVGTFTPEGTFEAIIPRIPELLELGITAIELMPVAQFPGDRNWGYDGVYPFGVQTSYGGVEGLKRLVNACHRQGMAVILDVVYNHLGPEGNYLWGLGTYFTDKYKTPWGSAVNYDEAYSPGVRHYFSENVRYWFETCHIDALRLDAIHAIYDFGAKHILQELAETTAEVSQAQGRKVYLIAESDLNDPRIIRPVARGGYGVDAQWSDDFHHALHTLLTGENRGYYQDYGMIHDLAKAYEKTFVYTWDYSHFRQRYHGSDPTDCPAHQFVVCSQNHDQVGNRMMGDRLSTLVPFAALKLAAAAVILSPYIPLLFMGEEYGETNPFLYFVSHGDPDLVAAVRAGRKQEFAEFHDQGEAPDPQAVETFERSRLDWDKRRQGRHQHLWQFYQTLLRLRADHPALANLSRQDMNVSILAGDQVLELHRWHGDRAAKVWMNVTSHTATVTPSCPPEPWKKLLDTSDACWGDGGSDLPDVISDQATRDGDQSLALAPYHLVVYGN
jgi:maltooligosyltrehalose trehalohydrolase